MNERFALAGKGLRFLFLAQILALVTIVVAFIPVLGWIAGLVLSVVIFVLELYGPYVARSSHPNFQNAFYASIAAVIVGIISAFFQEGFMAGLMDIVSSLVGFCITYFVCTAAGELLAEKGDTEQAARAGLIWKLYAICTVVSILCTLTGWIPVLNILMGVAAIISGIVSLVAYILLIIFYYKASNSLKAA